MDYRRMGELHLAGQILNARGGACAQVIASGGARSLAKETNRRAAPSGTWKVRGLRTIGQLNVDFDRRKKSAGRHPPIT